MTRTVCFQANRQAEVVGHLLVDKEAVAAVVAPLLIDPQMEAAVAVIHQLPQQQQPPPKSFRGVHRLVLLEVVGGGAGGRACP